MQPLGKIDLEQKRAQTEAQLKNMDEMFESNEVQLKFPEEQKKMSAQEKAIIRFQAWELFMKK